jgi:hypothetical protein
MLKTDSHRRSYECPYKEYTLKDLIHDTVYSIQVSANSEHGEGNKSPVIVVKLLPLGKSKQYVAGVVKCPFCKQTELVFIWTFIWRAVTVNNITYYFSTIWWWLPIQLYTIAQQCMLYMCRMSRSWNNEIYQNENPLKFIVTLINILTQLFLYKQKLDIKHNKRQSFSPVKFFATFNSKWT